MIRHHAVAEVEGTRLEIIVRDSELEFATNTDLHTKILSNEYPYISVFDLTGKFIFSQNITNLESSHSLRVMIRSGIIDDVRAMKDFIMIDQKKVGNPVVFIREFYMCNGWPNTIQWDPSEFPEDAEVQPAGIVVITRKPLSREFSHWKLLTKKRMKFLEEQVEEFFKMLSAIHNAEVYEVCGIVDGKEFHIKTVYGDISRKRIEEILAMREVTIVEWRK